MARFYKLKNLGPAPSMEELAVMAAQYEMSYGDTYDQWDNSFGGDLWDELYGSALFMVSGNPRGLLTHITSELMEYEDDPIDAKQIPMLKRLRDSTKAYIAARGL